MDVIIRYDWPGNVRELKNALERAVAYARGDFIAPEDLPPAVLAGAERQPRASFHGWKGRTLERPGRGVLGASPQTHRGHVTPAAPALPLPRSPRHRLLP